MPLKKPFFHHTFYPALAVILACAAFIGVYAYSVWPTDQELNHSATTIIHKKTKSTLSIKTAISTDPATKDWKSYSDPAGAYAALYPPTYVAEQCDNGDYFAVPLPNNTSLCDGIYQGIFIQSRSETTASDAANKDKLVATSPVETTATVSGLTATHLTWSDELAMGGGGLSWDVYYVLTANGVYEIANSDGLQTATFNTFLSTLTFN